MEWLKRLTDNAKVATVLGSIAVSSDTVESEGASYEAVLNYIRNEKIPLFGTGSPSHVLPGPELHGSAPIGLNWVAPRTLIHWSVVILQLCFGMAVLRSPVCRYLFLQMTVFKAHFDLAKYRLSFVTVCIAPA